MAKNRKKIVQVTRQGTKPRAARQAATVNAAQAPRPSEFAATLNALQPYLDGVPIGSLRKSRIAQLAQKTGIRADDLSALVTSHRLAEDTKMPVDALFALVKQYRAIDSGLLASARPADLRKEIESAIKKNRVPAATLASFDGATPALARLQTHEAPLRRLAATYDLQLPQSLLRKLESRGIKTLADVRSAGGADALAKKLNVKVDDLGLQNLVSHAHLSLLGTDVACNAILIEQGYTRISEIADAPDGVFIARVGPEVGNATALRMKRVATAQRAILRNKVTDALVNSANGFEITAGLIPQILNVTINNRCSCEDCSSAVSPLAYLADLIGYATTKLGMLKNGLMPVYRLFNPNTGDHFYTQTILERDTATGSGYRYEGIGFYILSAGSQNLTRPLYRLFHPANEQERWEDHFYTRDPGERDNAKNKLGYVEEPSLGYVYDVSGSAKEGRTPIYRLLNDASHDHFYTTDRVERDNAISQAGYHKETGVEIAGYVPIEADDLLSAHGLEEIFLQPFNDLPTSCEMMDEKVRQVRICIEVLRAYGKANNITLPQSFRDAEAQYRRDTYQALLLKLGTSYAGLRASRGAPQEDRESLATALGIPVGDGNQRDYLGELLLDIDTVNESDLERLFGLVDTTRDVLSHGTKLDDAREQVKRWNLAEVSWNVNTDSDGCVFVSLAQSGARTKVQVYRAAGTTSTAFLEASAESDTGQAQMALVPYIVNGRSNLLAGELDIDYVAVASNIKFQVVPQFVSWRLQTLRKQWQEQDWITDGYSASSAAKRLPVVDPDLIGPDDFRDPFGTTGTPFVTLWQTRRRWIDQLIHDLLAVVFTGTATAAIDAFPNLLQEMDDTSYAGATKALWPTTAESRLLNFE